MSDDESKMKVAGHPPAVKAGGMRIVQHKSPASHSQQGKDRVEVVGLSDPAPAVQSEPVATHVPPATAKHEKEAEVTHAHGQTKPAVQHAKPASIIIQQPRK